MLLARGSLPNRLAPFSTRGGVGVMSKFSWVEGYEGKYKIYDDGRVESFSPPGHPRSWEPRFMKPQTHGSGKYLAVLLCKNAKVKKFYIHALVAKHFVPGYQEGLVVNHKNGNTFDNSLENLEWVTKKENNIHAIRTGLNISRLRRVNALNPETGKTQNFKSIADAAKQIGGSKTSIWACLNHKKGHTSHKGYRWSYA